MIYTKDTNGLLACLRDLDTYRKLVEDEIQSTTSIICYCCCCNGFKTMAISPARNEWRDLRGEITCESCKFASRFRLLFNALLYEREVGKRPTETALIFERVTPFYDLVRTLFPVIHGVEYGGPQKKPGELFEFSGQLIQHEDMQELSYDDETFDLIVHSDVLEHVPDPFVGMAEIHRVLKPGGTCIFSCPIYTRLEHRVRAYLDTDREIVFTEGPAFHGNPLTSAGSPVFYEFGLALMDDLIKVGFDCEIGIDHSLTNGYLSNNNPFPIGHMWPLVIRCRKPTQ